MPREHETNDNQDNNSDNKTLIEKIKNTLQKEELSKKMQRELAILLFLRSILEERNNERNTQKIKIVDLAILTILENKGQDKKNQFFVKQIRQNLEHESIQPNPLIAMLLGHGGSYNRLISGLTWYFIVFVIFPSLITGAVFLGYKQEGVSADDLIPVVENQQKQLEKANEINKNLQVTLEQALLLSSEAKKSQEPSTQTQDVDKFELINKTIEESLNIAKKNNSELNQLKDKDKEIKQSQDDATKEKIKNSKTANSLFLEQDLFFISLAITMGALGSITSIIVRSKEFIQKSEDEEKDLFFVGFLRPFVGMSFAILTVSLLESGAFFGISGIPDNSTAVTNQNNRNARTVYLYMTIAFVAGFSERLVQDFVSTAENRFK